jgi:hypothetical protein
LQGKKNYKDRNGKRRKSACFIAEIEKAEDSGAKAYSEIWKKHLEPAVKAVNAGKQQEAHDIYKGMVLDLKGEYLK